jgi:hypothetical protein
MPADKYGKSLYKAGTMKSEKAAIANRDPARKAAAEKVMKREGTTSPAGGRPAAKNLGAISNKDRQMLTSAAAKIKPTAAPRDLGTLNNKNLGAISNKDRRMLTSAAAKIKPAQTIRTTVLMKPTPTKKK